MSGKSDILVFFLFLTATLVLAMLVSPGSKAWAGEKLSMHAHGGPPHHWHHPPPPRRPHHHRPPHATVVFVEPRPAVVVAPSSPAPAPDVVAAASAEAAAQPYCREYQGSGTIGGKPQVSYGTACLQPDGSWKIVSQNP